MTPFSVRWKIKDGDMQSEGFLTLEAAVDFAIKKLGTYGLSYLEVG